MREITLEELLEAGCHFGHQITRSNPKARDFIFEARDGIHIIDLAKTKAGLEEAGAFVRSIAQRPDAMVVVVGTKRQAHGIIEEEIKKTKEEIANPENDGIYSVTQRWIGGLLTNFPEVSKNFKKLIDLTSKLKNPAEQEGFTKKEIGLWGQDKQKLERLYGGVYSLKRKPDLLFVIDSHLEKLALSEALKTGVPTVAITDTNSDPNMVDYPIPANDDAVGSIQLIVSYIMSAWIEGKKIGEKNAAEAAIKAEKDAAKAKEEAEKKAKEDKVKAAAEAKKAKTPVKAAKPKIKVKK